jgi:hypothetical protein
MDCKEFNYFAVMSVLLFPSPQLYFSILFMASCFYVAARRKEVVVVLGAGALYSIYV